MTPTCDLAPGHRSAHRNGEDMICDHIVFRPDGSGVEVCRDRTMHAHLERHVAAARACAACLAPCAADTCSAACAAALDAYEDRHAAGWPAPGCTCALCTEAAKHARAGRTLALARAVADVTGVPDRLLLSDVRAEPVRTARRVLYLALSQAGIGASEAGRAIGRDHTTVMLGQRAARAVAARDDYVLAAAQAALARFGAGRGGNPLPDPGPLPGRRDLRTARLAAARGRRREARRATADPVLVAACGTCRAARPHRLVGFATAPSGRTEAVYRCSGCDEEHPRAVRGAA